MEGKEISLFEDKAQCCACGACVNICPKNAISMELDECGYAYPQINKDKCVGCGACKKVCAFQNVIEKEGAKEVYASARKDTKKIFKSTSGGIFAVLAENILQKGGIVYGASMELVDGKLIIKHVGVDKLEELPKLQESKYVQSQIGFIYNEIKDKLQTGVNVLFSGTPCQVAALKTFLNKEYDNLFTVDIICHGVPNQCFFQCSMELLEKTFDGRIVEFKFRDKEKSWGHGKSKIVCVEETGETKEHYLMSSEYTYYDLFLNGLISRENCYHCKYTNNHRPGDITIGDYWGIAKMHPEFISTNGGKLVPENGISALIVNTDKGIQYLQEVKNELILCQSDFEKVAKANAQLREPCKYHVERDYVLKLYREKGYDSVHRFALKQIKKRAIKAKIKGTIKKILHKK